MVDHQGLAQQLQHRRAELRRELDRLTAPPEAGGTIGFGERIGEGTSEAIERFTTTRCVGCVT
jgi:DnaK suppressor protein